MSILYFVFYNSLCGNESRSQVEKIHGGKDGKGTRLEEEEHERKRIEDQMTAKGK